jgi:ribonuclease BN (tRNA processing enzyme)
LEAGETLSLTNDGALELFFIGVGSGLADEHFYTNLLLIKGDTHIMVDFGEGASHALRETSGLTKFAIETVLPTHSHDDHVGGIGTLAVANRYVSTAIMGKPKLKMIIGEEFQRELWTHTLQGSLEHNEVDPDGARLQFSDYFEVVRPEWARWRPRETWIVDYGGIHLEMFRTIHIPEQSRSVEAHYISYGLFIDDHVFYSGDTKFDPDLIGIYGARSEAMFHDVQFFDKGVHAPLESLRTLPADVRSRMHLVHYADSYREQDISGFAGWTKQAHRYIFE